MLGILLKAKKEGKLESLTEVIEELIDKAGFRIGKDILNELLQGDARVD